MPDSQRDAAKNKDNSLRFIYCKALLMKNIRNQDMLMQVDQISTASAPVTAPRAPSEQLEQAFLEEMLKYCGPKSNAGAFGGGIGEDQFSSFLIQEQAAALAARMDLGFGEWVAQ
jgi:hypothetical protein